VSDRPSALEDLLIDGMNDDSCDGSRESGTYHYGERGAVGH
jgi:hypothetical protein